MDDSDAKVKHDQPGECWCQGQLYPVRNPFCQRLDPWVCDFDQQDNQPGKYDGAQERDTSLKIKTEMRIVPPDSAEDMLQRDRSDVFHGNDQGEAGEKEWDKMCDALKEDK